MGSEPAQIHVPRIGRRQALLGACALFLACKSSATQSKRSVRVVSISPSTTEAIFALGAGDVLVGRSKYCDFPPEAQRLPVVGGYADPSIEAVLALRPTLVVGARGPAGAGFEQTLNAQSIETYFPETESIAQIESALTELGRRLDKADAARRLNDAIEQRVRDVQAAVAGKPAVRAAMLFDVNPIVVAGPSGFPDELLRLSGGKNVVTEGGGYPTIGIERLLALDPDVLLDASSDGTDTDPTAGIAGKRDAPGFRELRAVRENRIRRVNGAELLRPGPRIADGLVTLARALHGDGLPIRGT